MYRQIGQLVTMHVCGPVSSCNAHLSCSSSWCLHWRLKWWDKILSHLCFHKCNSQGTRAYSIVRTSSWRRDTTLKVIIVFQRKWALTLWNYYLVYLFFTIRHGTIPVDSIMLHPKQSDQLQWFLDMVVWKRSVPTLPVSVVCHARCFQQDQWSKRPPAVSIAPAWLLNEVGAKMQLSYKAHFEGANSTEDGTN